MSIAASPIIGAELEKTAEITITELANITIPDDIEDIFKEKFFERSDFS